MNNRHLIEHAIFDISFGSEEQAFEQQSNLGSFCKQRLMRVINQVFDEMSTDGLVVQIDRLELDLGSVPYNGFQREMERRLRESLKEALQDKLLSLKTQPGRAEGVITAEASALEQLQYFLIHGHIPWNANLRSDHALEQLLQAVVRTSGSQFIAFLRSSPQRATVVKRLISQFPDEMLVEIAEMLAPSERRLFACLVDDFPERQHRLSVWEHLIDALLEADETVNCQWIIDDCRAMIESLPRVDSQSLITHSFVEGLARGDVEAIRDMWQTLLREQQGLLKNVLRYYGRQGQVRRRIADSFPEPMLRDIVRLFEPTAIGFIDEIIERPELFRHAIHNPPEDADSRKRRLWEFTLAYLLVERGTRFNKKAYMASLVRQMAAHDNMRYPDLLHSMIGVLEQIKAPNALKSELLQLLTEFYDEHSSGQTAPETSEAQSQSLIHSYGLYERLRQHLLEGRQGNEGDLTRLIEQLTRTYPWQLLRLYRELQAGLFSGAKVSAALSSGELSCLIKAFVSLSEHGSADEPSDLIHALEAYAGQARERGSEGARERGSGEASPGLLSLIPKSATHPVLRTPLQGGDRNPKSLTSNPQSPSYG